MAKLYTLGSAKEFFIDFKQVQLELLVEYSAEINYLYGRCPIENKKIDKIQNNVDLIEERPLKQDTVRNKTKFIENKETRKSHKRQVNFKISKNLLERTL